MSGVGPLWVWNCSKIPFEAADENSGRKNATCTCSVSRNTYYLKYVLLKIFIHSFSTMFRKWFT